MHIIIVGGGGVGYELGRNLSTKDQDVVIIEKNPKKVKEIEESLDVMVVEANGASVKALQKAGVKNAQMLIAVTHVDETNIIACMMAKRLGVPITVARVRNQDYIESSDVLPSQQIGIDFIINPEKVAAQEISHAIHFPDASDVEYFAEGRVKLVGLTVHQEADITNRPLKDVPLPPGCIIVGIDRPNEEFLVPSGKDQVKPGDKIYLLGSARLLRSISWLLQHPDTHVGRVTILGGGNIGYRVASMIESQRKQHFSLKIVEKDPERCSELSSQLSRTLVLHGDATDLSFFKEEEIVDADMLVVVTGEDRTNIVAAVLAKQLGVRKVVCEVIDPQYVPIYLRLGIDSLINPHLLAASRILRFTRREDVVSLSVLQDQNAEVVELILPEEARVVGKKIVQAGLPRGVLIGTIVRGEEIIIPHGETRLQAGDRLVVFALPEVSTRLNRYFAGSKRVSQEQKKKLVNSQEI